MSRTDGDPMHAPVKAFAAGVRRNLMALFPRLAPIVAALLLSSCIMAEYDDVSAEPAYRDLVGRRLRSQSLLHIHAVTLDRNYAPVIGQYSITAPPGFDGPEVLSRDTLPAGTVFKTLSVRRCTNCLFQNKVDLMVELPPFSDAPVELSYELLATGRVTVVP